MFQEIDISNKDGPKMDFEALKKLTFVDLSVKLERPETLISIGEHYYKNQPYPTSVMTAGEFSMIVAPSKTKKSYLKSAFAGALMGNKSKHYFDNIRGHLKSDDDVIADFDTEQSRYYAQKTFSRAEEIAGRKYANYFPYMLRMLAPRERVLFIEYILYNTPNIKYAFIDGIADLVNDTNDLAESVELATFLLKWTEELQIHICVIMHSAYGTEKATGHLGSTLIKKAESVILLKPTDASKKVIQTLHQYSRGYSFDDFYFSIKNTDAMPYKVDDLSYDFPTAEGDTISINEFKSEQIQFKATPNEAFTAPEDVDDVPF